MGLIYMGSLTIVSLWFDEHRATACGIVVSASGLGTFLNAYMVELVIKSYNWRDAMLIEAVFVSLCSVVALLLLHPPPRAVTFGETHDNPDIGFFKVSKELFQTPSFIAFFINNLAWPFAIVVFYTFAVRVAIEEAGFDILDAAFVVSVTGLVDGLFRFSGGFFSSTFKIPPSYFYFFGQVGVGMVIAVTPFIHSEISPYFASVLFGLCFGIQMSCLVPATAELFHPEKISTVFGLLIVSNGISAGLGPILSDILLEYINSYRVLYLLNGALVFVGQIVILPFLISHWKALHRMKKERQLSSSKVSTTSDTFLSECPDISDGEIFEQELS